MPSKKIDNPALKSRLLIAAGVMILVFAGIYVFYPGLNGEWAFDDKVVITKNSSLYLSELSWQSLKAAAASHPISHEYGVPLFYLSLALNYYLSGIKPLGFHAVNLAIHLAAAAALFLWFYRLLTIAAFAKEPREERSGALFCALAAALIWVVHPVQTDAVTYISSRKFELTSLFFIAAHLFYLYARAARGASAVLWYAAVIGAGFLALSCRQNAVMLPVSLLFSEFVFFRRRRFRERILPLCGAGVIFIMALWLFFPDFSQRSAAALEKQNLFYPLVLSLGRILVFYISVIVYPAAERLAVDYDFTASQNIFTPPGTLPAWILTAVLLCWAGRASRLYFFALIWFVVLALLDVSLYEENMVFLKRLHLPLAGFCLGLAALCREVRLRFGRRGKALLFWLVVLVIILLGSGTIARNMVWRQNVSLWEDAAAKAPLNPRILSNLAAAYLEQAKATGDAELLRGAASLCETVLATNPRHTDALVIKAGIYHAAGRLDEAANIISQGIPVDPPSPLHFETLGRMLLDAGRPQAALAVFDAARQSGLNPAAALSGKAQVLSRLGQRAAAEELFLRALTASPNDDRVHNRLGWFYLESGLMGKALNEFRAAAEIFPFAPENLSDLALALQLTGDTAAATQALTQALKYSSRRGDAVKDFPAAFKTADYESCRAQTPPDRQEPVALLSALGQAYYDIGNYGPARAYWSRAAMLAPENECVKSLLGRIFNGVLSDDAKR